MRLSNGALMAIEHTVRRALSGECRVYVAAPTKKDARRMFMGVSPHIERFGGDPDPRRLMWQMPNGSCILIEVS